MLPVGWRDSRGGGGRRRAGRGMTEAAATLEPLPDIGGPAQPLLTVRGLTKHFPLKSGFFGRGAGVVQAVDSLDFEVRKGETLGIVGESGCGKSTTSRLVMALMQPTAGEVVFDGRAVGGRELPLKEYRRQVQMVFQDSYASLNPRLTIEESIAFSPEVHGLARHDARARARDLLAAVGLNPDGFARRYPHELSGGQRQRVNIARALALRPRLVILDEPVSALDKSVEAQVLNLLQDLKAEFGLTYIFISHDLNVVQYMSDRVLVMYLGKVAEVGPVEAIYAAAAHPYTAALLASRPSMDPDLRRTEPPLTGDPPNPINPPAGCRFHTRCGFAEPLCSATVPPLHAAPAGQQAACLMVVPESGHSRAPKVAA
ncbi:ABC transporter ATP-binding protein [Roseomonas populi]|uniref:Glutathione import ATP-binding protein GsiA n=1 Tax=Roseomonas populi TaxID=3121582 RepID=A0ABT1XEM7_9PROT|nr:ABC transporter ATP-binding protein [Roseomonas pecuniae]MCR0985429.1 ABC transporter ATP-binding protein [Roseomonas pecuniae]